MIYGRVSWKRSKSVGKTVLERWAHGLWASGVRDAHAPRGIRTVFYFRSLSKYKAQGNSPRLCDDIAIKRPALLFHNFSCCSVSHAYDIHTAVCAVASLSIEVVDSVYGI